MVPPKPEQSRKSILGCPSSLRPYQLTKPYIKNNYVFIAFLGIFVIVNIALFTSRMYQYRDSGPYIMVARACGKKQYIYKHLN